MLYGAVYRKLVLVVVPELVVANATAIDDMLGLLGNICLVRLQVKLITSTAELVGGLLLEVQATEL